MRAPGPTYRRTMVTCFTCGLPSSKEWAQRVSTRPSASQKRPYFPFLSHIQPPPGAVLEADGTALVCAFCHASLVAQWRNFETQASNQSQIRRVYSLGKFICGVCGVTTYRKRIRTLPVQEFPFLTSQRPSGSLTFGNNLLAVVCLDCYETLRTQNEEYDRWGFPLQKRRFNWLARQPPDPNSPEAGVARLPCGKMKLPSCPPTEPAITPAIAAPDHRMNNTPVESNKTHNINVSSSPSSSATTSSEEKGQNRTRKLSVVYTSNPFTNSATRVHSPPQEKQPSVVTQVPNASQTTPVVSIGKELKSTPALPIISHRPMHTGSSGAYRPRPLVPIFPCEGIQAQGGARGSSDYLSSSVPNGTVLVPAVIYRPRRKLSPHCGRRYSSALSFCPSLAPYRIPLAGTGNTSDCNRTDSSSNMRMPYPQSLTSPWVPLQKFSPGGSSSVKRRRFSETSAQESDSPCTRKYSDSRIVGHSRHIEPLLMVAESNNERCTSELNLHDASFNLPGPSPSSSCHKLHEGPESNSPEEAFLSRKLKEAVITEPDTTFREPLRPSSSMDSYAEKGIPIRKRRSGYESMDICSGESASSSPGVPFMLEVEPTDSGVHSIGNDDDDDEDCVIDLSFSATKRNSIYSSDPSVRVSVQNDPSSQTGGSSNDSIRRNRSMGSLEGMWRVSNMVDKEAPAHRRSSVIVERQWEDIQM